MFERITEFLNGLYTLRVTIVMRSGERIVFYADKISVTPDTKWGSVAEMEWEGAVGAPRFLALPQVDLVFWKRVFRLGQYPSHI